MSAKYACIEQHRDTYAVTLMCAALAVAPAGYYDWRRRAAMPTAARGPRARANARLAHEIRVVHRETDGTYGSPRVHAELTARGVACSENRVARVMRAAGLRAAAPRRRGPRTTDSAHAHPVAPNVLARQFAVPQVGGLDRVWAGDITYLPTRAGWCYLAVVLDLASRRVIGWAVRETLAAELATSALEAALGQRRPGAAVLFHSDRGSQYAGGDYQALLAAHGITGSMSRRGNCWDNAVAESFFATLERELIDRSDWRTRAEAQRAIFRWIELWYNRKRRHSALGYLSPADYEQQLRRRAHDARAA